MNNGFWLLIDKASNISSANEIQFLKRIFKPLKVGHAGTLDPFASGLLLVAVGQATRLIEYAVMQNKAYNFTVNWGINRDTLDITGNILETSNKLIKEQDIINAIPNFIGSFMQKPPIYSAIKINGQRSYKLARSGIAIDLKSREVYCNSLKLINSEIIENEIENEIIYNKNDSSIALNDINLNFNVLNKKNKRELLNKNIKASTFHLECSKGFYVRSLARDIAQFVDNFGYVSYLRRTKIGKFSIDDAITIKYIKDLISSKNYLALKKHFLPFHSILDDITVYNVSKIEYEKLKKGQKIKCDLLLNNINTNYGEELNNYNSYNIYKDKIAIFLGGKILVAIGMKEENFIVPHKTFFIEEVKLINEFL